LPSSYKSFLSVTNGWRCTGPFIKDVWSTEEIDWYRVRHQDLIDAWLEGTGTAYPDKPPVPDDEYFVYGDDQDTTTMRDEYLQTALQVSEIGDDAVYFLNSQIIAPNDEWEA